MIIDTHEALERYSTAKSTFMQTKYQDVIKEAGGLQPRVGSGRTRNLYKTSVLDKLAREDKLGTDAYKSILNLDAQKEKETS